MTIRTSIKVEDCNVEARPFAGAPSPFVDLAFTPHGHHPSQGAPPFELRLELRSVADIEAVSDALDEAQRSFDERETRHGIRSVR